MAQAIKRAITLAGGGPAAGLHIGVLERLKKENIKFDVWALSCIGAWVGLVYNQCDEGKEVEQTYKFFRDGVFRDDASYRRFPVNSVFGTDNFANASAVIEFFTSPNNLKDVWLPKHMMDAARDTLSFMTDQARWNRGDFNRWILNSVLAANPFVRYWSSLMYLSNISGLSRIHYPESTFIKDIHFERLYQDNKPFIFHNAWNISQNRLELFSNKTGFKSNSGTQYGPITSASLCACSALPYIEETVQIGKDIYCEGALVDTVNFKELLEDHPDLQEVWVNRIVDSGQVRPPKNIADALANLCMLFAATVGDDDIKLFRYHVQNETDWQGRIVEITVSDKIDFHWTHSNLDLGRKVGFEATDKALQDYKRGGESLKAQMDRKGKEARSKKK
ncbi:MAG TPA: patatin-like phospholipase family protein [Pseudolabrys sp.]|nr:patatin-like phospholipase family protein [Pseudolabrys sp.]